MIYGDLIYENNTVIQEFDLKETIKNIIARVKKAIYNLLSRLEKAVSKCKDSGFKSIILKAIGKLKSLLAKSDNINSPEDANKISKEVEDIKLEVNEETKKIVDEAIAAKRWLRLRIMIGDGILIGDSDSLLSYLRSKDIDIFHLTDEYIGDTITLQEPNYDSLSLEQLEDLFNSYVSQFKDGVACTEVNYRLIKKLWSEIRKRSNN